MATVLQELLIVDQQIYPDVEYDAVLNLCRAAADPEIVCDHGVYDISDCPDNMIETIITSMYPSEKLDRHTHCLSLLASHIHFFGRHVQRVYTLAVAIHQCEIEVVRPVIDLSWNA